MKTDKTFYEKYLDKVCILLIKVEDIILVALLTVMITMSFLQIFLRNIFGAGIVWNDLLIRIIVLWIGLVGAMVASRKGEHISISIVSNFLTEKAKAVSNCIVDIFTATVCTVAAYYSLLFVKMEFTSGDVAFHSIPSWICESIIPVAFFVIALRYTILFFRNFSKLMKLTK